MLRITIAGATRALLALPLALAASGPAQAGPSAYRVKDINPGAGGSDPTKLTDVNGTLFFVPADGELWKSDGTTLGTVMAVDIQPGSTSSNPNSLVAVAGTLYFIATGPSLHVSLWVSDGTAAGTAELYDIFAGYGPTPFFDTLTTFYGRLYFAGAASPFGTELWTSNGRTYGTYIVQDISPIFGDSNPSNLTVSGNLLYFVADDGVSGPELWAADVIFDSSFEFMAPPG